MVDGIEHASEVVDLLKYPVGLLLDLVGQLLDKPASAQRVHGLRHVGLVGEDLLCA